MKKFILGIIFTLFLTNINALIWLDSTPGSKTEKISWFIENKIVDGNYLINPLRGWCNNSRWIQYSDGTKITSALYFGCDKFQIFINRDSKE